MAHGMTRREFAATAAGLAAFGFGARSESAATKTLRLIASSDLRVLDPIWTTAGISRAHGYMVFDTPFALDANFRPQPQMVGDYDISTDQLVYSFTLRDELRFHDGMPVGGVDCVASLQRWMVRDVFGQSLAAAVDQMGAVGDKSFTIRLKEPFPLLLDALAKIAGPPFIMPERLAKTHTNRSPRRWAPARTNLSRKSSNPATWPSMSRTRTTCRAVSPRAGHRAARSSRSTGSSGCLCPTT
jgi:peptide/nickel transport system substrate-binding protein